MPEYWRFDPSGGRFYPQALAGDRLVNGVYQPIAIQSDGEDYWGYSEALGLTVCWEAEKLRWWDRSGERYLATHADEARRRQAAEERIRQLEEELAQLRQSEK